MPSTTATVAATRDGQVVKRRKLDVTAARDNVNGANQPSKRTSRIFAPFRTIGLISPTDVPFSIDPRGKTTFNITTSVGRSLQTYDLRRGLHLVFITRPQTPENITAIADYKDHTLAAWGNKPHNGLWVYKRGQKVGQFENPPGKSEAIKQILPLGSWIVGCGTTRIEVWNSATFEHHTTINVGQGRKRATISGGICNMPTYLNKILVGTSDGCLEVWNVSTGKLRYTIFPSESDVGAVTTVEPTPALSLFAVAHASGEVVIHDVRADKPVISLNAGSEQAPVSTISFRSDGLGAGKDGRKAGVMATATKAHGDVTFWDLNNGGRKMGVLRGAHSPPSKTHRDVSGGISKVEFLPGQGVIVTSGMDNALKSWIFDEQPFSSIPRPLHSRSGHAAPVSSLEFLPASSDGSEADGKWLMSASRDRSLWGWSLRRDAQSSELSQGNVRKKAKNMGILNNAIAGPDGTPSLEELKAPKIACMACSLNRDGGMGAMPGTKEIWVAPGKHKTASTAESSMTGWESVVTGHEGDKFARTWFWGRKRAGRWKFETGDGSNVTSVAISPCGTFALLGSEAGGIDMYNLQSGIRRQRFPAPLTRKQAERLKAQMAKGIDDDAKFVRGQGKHTKAVTGIQVDSLNQTVISCGADGKTKFWDFNKGVLLHELDWSLTSIRFLQYHRSTDLIALSCDDSSIRVVDIVTKKLVRELWGCNGKILDFIFSNDGRWLVAISEDSVLRMWDLPTGHLIEALRFKNKPTAIAFSPTGEYLATAHEGCVGVHIWNNRTLFTNVPARRIASDDIVDIDAPVASGENTETALEAAFDAEQPLDPEDESATAPSIDQLSADLLTLSLVPKARWQTLLHLDAIRARNKPKEAPKAPEKAPFFLPSLDKSKTPDAVTPTTALAVQPPPQDKAVSRISTLASSQQTSTSTFTSLLLHNPPASLAYLATLPPSAADLAIRTLDPSPPYTELTTFVSLLTQRLREKRDYELVQAWMSVFLQCHGGVVLESGELRDALETWRNVEKGEVSRLGDLVGFCKGVGGWIGGVV